MSTSKPIEQFPFPTTTQLAAARARVAFGEGVRAPWFRPLRPIDCEALEHELGREPSAAEWTRFSIVFGRALKAMETAPEGAATWDDNTERWVA